MNVQTEKSLLIDLLQNINDISLIQKVKDYLMNEIQPQNLTSNQKDELEKRLKEHNENRNSGSDAFEFLDTLKSKYEL
jgi:putative addiction module component (TIGR02574 family)